MIWVILHLAAALAVGAFAGRLRTGRWTTLDGLLEFGVAFALPGAGAPAVLLGLGLERLFARTARPATAADLTEEPGPGPARPPFPPEDVLRIGVDAGPVEDRLCSDDSDALELCLQRLARSRSKDALDRLREAGSTSRADVRVRLRTLMVRLEREFMRDVREGPDPGVRGSARARLASSLGQLNGHPTGARALLLEAQQGLDR